MKRRPLALILGLAVLLLLAVGALWPVRSEAERKAALLHVGMTEEEIVNIVRPDRGPRILRSSDNGLAKSLSKSYGDGSALFVEFDPEPIVDGMPLNAIRAAYIDTSPPPTVPPLTRLRRTLARAFPFLGE
jgi:hypothetical protein